MPYLRVVRDKRGYETTYLLHSPRDGSHQGSRIIYVFRSPGGVRVGREPFDSDVRREIEIGHPEIAFNWDELVSGQHVIDAAPVDRRPRRRPGGAADRPPSSPPVSRRPEPQGQAPRLTVPAAIEGSTPELQMRFLAQWHGTLCEELPQRVADPQRRELLMTLAQRLNPAGWLEPDEIATGLQDASEALEQLSRVLSKRRRKARRSGPRAVAESQPSPEAETASVGPDEESTEQESSLVAEETEPDEPEPA